MDEIKSEVWLAGLFNYTVKQDACDYWSIRDGDTAVGSIIRRGRYSTQMPEYTITMKTESGRIYYQRGYMLGLIRLDLLFDNVDVKMEIFGKDGDISIVIDNGDDTFYLSCSLNKRTRFEVKNFDSGVILSSTSNGKNYEIYTGDSYIKVLSNEKPSGIVIEDEKGRHPDKKTLEEYMREEYESDNSVAKSLLDSITNILKELGVKQSLRQMIGEELVDESGLGILLPKEDEKKKDDKKGARRKKLGEKS